MGLPVRVIAAALISAENAVQNIFLRRHIFSQRYMHDLRVVQWMIITRLSKNY